MSCTWVLVAHGSAGKILEVRKNGSEVDVVQEFTHPETAMMDRDIHTDRPGRTFESAGNLRHAKDYSEEPIDHERSVFAKEIADYLGVAFGENRFEKLILVSSPSLLGALRKSLRSSVTKVIAHELAKDLFAQGLTDAELIEKIRNDLNLACI